MSTTDHALATRDARDALKTKLVRTLKIKATTDLADIMVSVDDLLRAEILAALVQDREERRRQSQHEQAMRQTRDEIAAVRRETAALRGDEPPRQCTKCKRCEPAAEFYPDNSHTGKRRPHCKDCERAATRDRAARAKRDRELAVAL